LNLRPSGYESCLLRPAWDLFVRLGPVSSGFACVGLKLLSRIMPVRPASVLFVRVRFGLQNGLRNVNLGAGLHRELRRHFAGSYPRREPNQRADEVYGSVSPLPTCWLRESVHRVAPSGRSAGKRLSSRLHSGRIYVSSPSAMPSAFRLEAMRRGACAGAITLCPKESSSGRASGRSDWHVGSKVPMFVAAAAARLREQQVGDRLGDPCLERLRGPSAPHDQRFIGLGTGHSPEDVSSELGC
jgi:hypothetical protein